MIYLVLNAWCGYYKVYFGAKIAPTALFSIHVVVFNERDAKYLPRNSSCLRIC